MASHLGIAEGSRQNELSRNINLWQPKWRKRILEDWFGFIRLRHPHLFRTTNTIASNSGPSTSTCRRGAKPLSDHEKHRFSRLSQTSRATRAQLSGRLKELITSWLCLQMKKINYRHFLFPKTTHKLYPRITMQRDMLTLKATTANSWILRYHMAFELILSILSLGKQQIVCQPP